MPKTLAVLNIEDSKSDSDLIARVLKKAGYKTTFKRVETAAQMRAALKKRAWDIIISDHNLPQFDCFAALTLLQETGLDIPFIAVSRVIGEETAVAMMKAGAHDYLMKDNLTRLVPAVARELEQAEVRRERKQAEEALLASENRFRVIFEHANDAMHIENANDEILAVNSRMCELMGYSREELLKMRVADLQAPEKRKPGNVIKNELAQHGGALFEGLNLHRDGRYIPVEISIGRIEQPSGDLYVSVVRDITERKLTEEALRASEKRFRALIENSLDDISLLAADGTLIWESPSVIRNLNYAPNEFLGRNILELIHLDDLEQIQNLQAELIQNPASRQSGSFRIRRNDGTWRWVEAIATNLLNEPGIQAIVINYRDVTERKQAEQELRASEQLFRELVDNIEEVFWITGPTNKEDMYVSPAYKKVWGRPLKDVDDFVESVQPEDRPIVVAALEKQTHGEKTEIKYRVKHTDGSVHWVWDRAFPIYNISGELKSVAGIASDITERQRVEDAVRTSEERLRVGLNVANVAVFHQDMELRYVWMYRPQLGYTSEQIVGRTDAELLPLEASTQIMEIKQHVLETGLKEQSEVHMSVDGQTFVYDLVVEPLRNELGAIIGLMGASIDITERKQMQAALVQSEQAYRTLFENVPVGLYRTSADGHWLDANPALIRMFGYQDRASFLEVKVENLYVDHATNEKFYGEMVKNDIVTSMEAKLRKKDGTIFWAEDNIRVIRDEMGDPLFYEGSLIDITERKQAEEIARENEARYRSLFEDSPVSLVEEDFSAVKLRLDALRDEGIKDFRTYFASHPQMVLECISLVKIMDVNKAALKLFGAKAKTDLFQSLTRFVVNDSTQLFQNELISIAQGKSHFNWEGVNQTLDGRQIIIRLGLKVVSGYEDTLSKVIISIVDITAQMHAEKAIRESEKFLREAQMIAGLGSYTLDIPSEKWASSDILNQIFGIDGSYTRSIESWIALVHPDSRQEMSDYFANEVLGKHIRFDKEYKIVRKNDGAERWVYGLGKLEFNAQNQPVKMRGTIQDITERKQAEEVITQQAVKYETMLSTITEGFWLVDEQGRLLDVNDAYCSMSGYSKEELLQFTIQDIDAAESLEETARHIQTIMEAGTDRFESKHRTKDGGVFDVEVSAAFWHERKRFFVFIQDITKRKQAKDLLRKSEKRYHDLFEDSPIALRDEDFSAVKQWLDTLRQEGVTDFHTHLALHPQAVVECAKMVKIKDVNKAALKMYRADSKDNMPKDLAEILSGKNLEHFKDQLAGIAEGQVEFSWEGIDQTIDGGQVYVEANWSVASGYENDLSKVIVSLQDITERKQAEEDLRGSEQRYHALFEDMPVSIWEEDFSDVKKHLDTLKGQGITDFRAYFASNPDAVQECASMIKILDVNQATLKMYHAGSKEDLLKSMDDGLSKSELKHITDALIAITEGRNSYSLEGADETVTGKPINISLNWTVAPGHEADFSKVIVTTVDITERKQSEEALIKSEKRFRSLIANAGDLIVVIDTDGTIQFASPASERILGYSPEEAIGRNFTEWVHPDSLAKVLKSLSGRLQEPGVALESITVRGRHKNGSWRILDTIGTNLINEPAIQGIVLNIRDITERELTEEALRASEAQFRALFEGAAIGIALVDTSGHAFKNNPALQELLGYSAQELGGMVFTEFTHPEDVMTDWTLWQELITGGREHYQIEKRFIHKSGRIIWVKLTTSIVADAAGQVLFGVGMVEDITDRKQAEAEIKYQLSELEVLYENGLVISSLLEPKQIAQRMVEIIEKKLDWHHAAIRLYDTYTDSLELLALNSPETDQAQIAEQIERINQTINTPDKGLSGWVIRHGEAVRIGKLKDDPRYIETYAGINSGLYVPIKSGDRVIGAISIESEKENAFTERDANTLTTLANQAAIAFVNARLYLWLQKELNERYKAEEEVRKLNTELEQRVIDRTAQIEAAKHRLELATQAGQIGVWEFNPRENKVIWDERMHMIHQIPVGEFDGTSQTWAQLIHPEDIEQSQLNQQLAVTKNLLMNKEHRIILADGSVRHVMTSAVTANTPEGIPDRIIGINMDITERKQIEQSLRESETYARLLFDAVTDPVSVTEYDGSIVDVNREFEKKFGIMRDDARGKRISELHIFPETELDKREKYITEILQGRPAKPVELDYYVPGDRSHTVELHAFLINVSGRQLVLNSSHDITAYKIAEEVQRLAKSEMERALRTKNEFLANMSHELRTPLTGILGLSEALQLKTYGELTEKQYKTINTIEESGRHLLTLINDILDLSKIEAGKLELQILPCSIADVCQASLKLIKGMAHQKRQKVHYSPTAEPIMVHADARRLKQILVNLLSNAVKFTAEEGELGLEIQVDESESKVKLTVWDKGIGIKAEDLRTLFNPFTQIDSSLAREYSGTGLGLYLVQRLTELHNGGIEVDSVFGEGSRFTIILPLSDQISNSLLYTQGPITKRLSSSATWRDPSKLPLILLADDNEVVLQMIADFLETKQFRVIKTRNGVELLEQALKFHPDIVLVDIQMPVMDGLETIRRIRANEDPSVANVPVIAVTALAMPGDREFCLRAGANIYMSKPVGLKELFAVLQKQIGNEQ